jgi:hypothetical protein
MSHFTVLVIGENPEEQLEPFWELDLSQDEMANDPRAVFVDETKEVIKNYNEGSSKEFYSASSGYSYKVTQEQFNNIKQSPIGRKMILQIKEKDPFAYLEKNKKYRIGYSNKDSNTWIKVIDIISTTHPDENITFTGTAQIQKIHPPREISHKSTYSTIDKFARDWDGYIKVDGKYGYYHNPNAKWDWHLLGGRWTGYFKMKETERVKGGNIGEPGIMTEPAKNGYADQCLKCDIDFEYMRKEEGLEAENKYENVVTAFNGEIPKTTLKWEEIKEENFDKKKEIYWGQPALKKLKRLRKTLPNDHIINSFYFDLQDFQCTKEEYIQKAIVSAISTFAVLKDNKWYGRGDMGWWGAVSDEKEQSIWDKEFNKLINELPDETLLSVFDCHI